MGFASNSKTLLLYVSLCHSACHCHAATCTCPALSCQCCCLCPLGLLRLKRSVTWTVRYSSRFGFVTGWKEGLNRETVEDRRKKTCGVSLSLCLSLSVSCLSRCLLRSLPRRSALFPRQDLSLWEQERKRGDRPKSTVSSNCIGERQGLFNRGYQRTVVRKVAPILYRLLGKHPYCFV